MKHLIGPALAGVVAAGAVSPALATSLLRMDLGGMVDQSTSIVVGEAVEQHSADTAYGFYTMTTFAVSDSVLGDANAEVTVATPGGVRMSGKFKVAEVWPGAPVFARGQQAIIFLNDDNAALGPQVVGFSQGVFPVMSTPQGKAVRMPDGGGEMVSLSAAKERIRNVVKSRAARRAGDEAGDN